MNFYREGNHIFVIKVIESHPAIDMTLPINNHIYMFYLEKFNHPVTLNRRCKKLKVQNPVAGITP